MFRGLFAHSLSPQLGVRAVSYSALKVSFEPQWNKNIPPMIQLCRACVGPDQWEKRRLDKTSVTVLYISGAGVHKSTDKEWHFTARCYNGKGEAVWFYNHKFNFFTNAIHFYPYGMPEYIDLKRFDEVLSNDPRLLQWCIVTMRDIKTGKKISK